LRLEKITHFKRSRIFLKGKSSSRCMRSLDRLKRAVCKQGWHEHP
jgi:hypothetical protein